MQESTKEIIFMVIYSIIFIIVIIGMIANIIKIIIDKSSKKEELTNQDYNKSIMYNTPIVI